MFPEYVKSAIDERERSIQELVRARKLANPRNSEMRWRSATRAAPQRPNGQRGL
jgi:hypothetical protein